MHVPYSGDIISLGVLGHIAFAGTSGGGLYRSNDNGNNWMPVAGSFRKTGT
jgi:hypothetical protein